ncbi:TMV resistance protein N-like [Abrus precatorius]|uniref:ADP-ribosyl cyclase/cyclic ADP-ribose hydrolase n=1 Tax=Abrus precatorius TaxID=3816 RepID=A0A8B8LV76_ABRPR|nr:TMV resistance protein N-like [Abrus precatorius]
MAVPPFLNASISYEFTYDVFLSFRGSDTRYGFIGNLYKALHDRGIRTFIDDEELQRGEEITPALVKAIEESRIAIPVFSNNYAASSFCLDELVNIIHSFQAKGRLVLPVFYHVDPSHVRHQRGTYGEALARQELKFKNNMEKVQNWRMALRQVANLSGWHFKHGDGYEHEFIEKIVKDVSRMIKHVAFPIADYPVGLDSHVKNVISLLEVGLDDRVHVVGIHGIGGIGKTTLAVAVYNFIADCFRGLCFLPSVREKSNKHGLVHLQKILLSELLGENEIELASVRQGISIIRHRLQGKKVLLILDDVDNLQQLEAMVGGFDWFGSGSRVIITTRDKHLLARHGVTRTYQLKELSKRDALQLLCWKAFKTEKVDPDYMDVLNRAVAYAAGLPLALVVIGSNLFGKSIEEWQSALDGYKRIPDKQIQKILKVSFDALKEDEQCVFLDIACCFKGYRLAEIEDILYAHHGSCMKYQIGVLLEKSLINLSSNDKVTLHDLIEDMGKEIVRQESPMEPGKRSRLWFPKDIVHVLEENTGTSNIEIIHLNFPFFEEVVVDWDGEAFKKMKNLKTLIIKIGCFSKGPKHLPNSLRLLEWWRYPSQDLPFDFYPKELATCKFPYDHFTSFKWASFVNKFVNIRVLNFDSCQCLTQINDLSGLPNLEELSFYGCYNLVTIHDSVGLLNRLKVLRAEGCMKLRIFPPLKLASLEKLELSYCSSLERFPEILGKMENITELMLFQVSIKEFPFSFRNLTRLQRLTMDAIEDVKLPGSIVTMPELAVISIFIFKGELLLKPEEGKEKVSLMMSSNVTHLYLQYTNLSNESLAIGLTWFANVKELVISCSNFTILPECIKECHFLRKLMLNDCYCLEEIQGIPPNLNYFNAINCISLTSSSRSMLLNQELHEAGNTEFCFPGARIPEWFEHQSMEPSISFWFRNKFPGIAICIVSSLTWGEYDMDVIISGNEFFFTIEHSVVDIMELDHTYLFDMQMKKFNDDPVKSLSENEWNLATITCEGASTIGIHVFKQERSKGDIRFTIPF